MFDKIKYEKDLTLFLMMTYCLQILLSKLCEVVKYFSIKQFN